MRTLCLLLLSAFFFSGCQSISPTYHRDPTFGAHVSSVFDAMIIEEPSTRQLVGSIYFEFDESELRDASKKQLHEIAQKVNRLDGPVIIEGHTDHVNTDAYNLRLGYKRAIQVAQYLRSAGVWEERMKVRSSSETRPADNNWQTGGRALNRRVDIVVFAQGGGMSGPEAEKAYKGMFQKECAKQNEGISIQLSQDNESNE